MKLLRFETRVGSFPVNGRPRYVSEDYAFDFQMDPGEKERAVGTRGTTSFVVDTLQLEVAVDRSLCIYVWGYSPMGKWKPSSLSPPMAHTGSLRVIHDEPLISAVSIGIEEMVPPSAWFDSASGWFCMGNNEAASDAEAVEFANNCLAVVVDGRLSSLWVKPENWKEVAEYLRRPRPV